MFHKIKVVSLSFIFTTGIILSLSNQISDFKSPLSVSTAQAGTIEVANPLEYSDVNSLSEQIRKYLLLIVGGITIIFIAVGGILYIIGGASRNERMVNMAKKALVGAIAGLVIILAAQMILSELYYIVLGKELSFQNLSASQILMRLINFLLAIVGSLFLISMLIGGIWYFSAGADESKIELGRKTITYSIVGITIAIAAMVVLRQINLIITGG